MRKQVNEPATKDFRLKGKLEPGERKKIKETIRSELSAEVYCWVIQQPPERYDKLPQDSRECFALQIHLILVKFCPKQPYGMNSALETITTSCLGFQVRSFLVGYSMTWARVHIDIGLDPHWDSSIDILHTILLGIDKYVWHKTSSAWNEARGKLFSIRLDLASSLDGLSGSCEDAEYLVSYKNNLIGRQFKFIQQLAIFHLHRDMCSDLVFDLWRATGELGALLWYPVVELLPPSCWGLYSCCVSEGEEIRRAGFPTFPAEACEFVSLL